ncbi:MAG: hypothetical protein RBQ97_06095 [Acholeplasma sp.]|nr:hypothetical protein [Acholeplasma sp.]
MAEQLDRIIEAEKKIQKAFSNAKIKGEKIVEDAIEKATLDEEKLHHDAEEKIQEIISAKKIKLAEIDEQLQNVVKKENEKIVKKISKKTDVIAEDIFKEVMA